MQATCLPTGMGEELIVTSGLPLGMVAESSYDESRFQLAHADRLTFVSDGVVEARNKSGELFGFDRTAAVSAGSAESIAEAARSFGQEDDITVISVICTAPLNLSPSSRIWSALHRQCE